MLSIKTVNEYSYNRETSRAHLLICNLVYSTVHLLPVEQTPWNKIIFVAVCSSYWNLVHNCISESIINTSPLRNQMI